MINERVRVFFLDFGRHWRIVAQWPKSSSLWRKRRFSCARQRAVWDDAERENFIEFLARNPEAGDVIPDTGSVRKVRWGRAGSGKRGGARVIYFYHDSDHPLYLLMVYAKARQEDLTPDEKRTVRELAEILKR